MTKHRSRSGSREVLSMGSGLAYPWGRPIRLLNILWFLIPIIGWFALAGYAVRIIRSIVRGNTKELPPFGSFWSDCGEGFMFIVRLIPLYLIIAILDSITLVGWVLALLVSLFLLPYLVLNTAVKGRIGASFEIQNVWHALTQGFLGYILALLKTILFHIIYGLLSALLIGFPCLVFGSPVYLADWFSRYWKN